MKKYLLLLILLCTVGVYAQIGIGTTAPNASASLHVESTTKGVLIPRMTLADRGGIAVGVAQTGLLIYQIDNTPGFYYYTGTGWTTFGGGGSAWGLTGNTGTTPGGNYLGTSGGEDFVIATDANEAIRITSTGNVGVGTATPSTLFHLDATAPGPISAFNDGFETGILTNFTTSGSGGNWSQTSGAGEFNTGSFGAGSGSGVDSSTSDLYLTVTIPAGGSSYSFDYKVSSEGGYDHLKFYVDGVIPASYSWQSGAGSWSTYNSTVNLTAGTHTLRWSYEKDGSALLNDDRVYIDNVTIANTTTPLSGLIIDDGNQANGFVLTSDANGVATWQAPAAGSGTDLDWAFDSGSGNSDPIFHQGLVKVGTATGSTRTLHVYNGTTSGSKLGYGSIEYFEDGVAKINIDHPFHPLTDANLNLGSSARRWANVYVLTVYNLSDKNLKTNISPLAYGLDEILKLDPISYKWKEEKKDDFVIPRSQKEAKIGFSAQQLLEVLPEVVQDFQWKVYEENPDELVKKQSDLLSVTYTEIIPVAVKAIQEQQKQILQLEKEIVEIERLIKRFEKKK